MWAICKKEWTQYFSGLTGYLIIGFYLIANGLFLFVLPNYNIFDAGYASLQIYFDFAPWFLLLLVPAITMRSFSDEYKQGTFEILSTLPIRPSQLVFAKFLGAFLIILFSILPTLIYAFVIDKLSSAGGIDWGATLGSYWGLFSLAAVYTSIGIYASSTTKNGLVALILSIIVSILLFKGFDWVSQISFFKNGVDYFVQQLGLSYHYEQLSKGVITGADFIYFLSIITIFTTGAIEQVKGKLRFVIIFVSILALNYFANVFPSQLDLTKDQRYTISSNSEKIIKEAEINVKVHLYLGGDIPSYYKKIAQSTTTLLNRLQKLNPGKIEWKLEVPNKIYKDTALFQFYDSLAKLGVPIERVQDQNNDIDKRVDQLVVPAAVIEAQGFKPYVIDLRSGKKYFKPYNIVKDIPTEDVEASVNAAEALLEYKFIQSIYLINRKQIPHISYLIGNGEPIDLTVNDIGNSIKNQYQLSVFDLKKGYPNANKIKTLVIVKPTTPFSDLDKLKLDQYILSGGNIIWAIDKLHAEYDSLQKTNGSYIAFDRSLNLDDLFFKYGIRINSNLVQDLNCAKLPLVIGKQADGSPNIQRIPWPYYPFLYGNENTSITQNMDRVLSLFPSSIDTLLNKEIKKTILLSTDTNSRLIASPNLVSLNSVKDEADLYSFKKHKIPVAVLLEGKFNSLYANQISNALKDTIKYNTGKDFLLKADAYSKQIVIADADIITNKTSKDQNGAITPLPMGMLPFEEFQFANKSFYLNTISYLNEPSDLLESRNKNIILRVLDKEKIAASRLFWQITLLASPILILLLFFVFWSSYRKGQFAS